MRSIAGGRGRLRDIDPARPGSRTCSTLTAVYGRVQGTHDSGLAPAAGHAAYRIRATGRAVIRLCTFCRPLRRPAKRRSVAYGRWPGLLACVRWPARVAHLAPRSSGVGSTSGADNDPVGDVSGGLFTAGTAWLAFRVVAGTILAAQTVLLMSPAIRKRGGTRYEARPQTDLTND
jgi:hypothetical protein